MKKIVLGLFMLAQVVATNSAFAACTPIEGSPCDCEASFPGFTCLSFGSNSHPEWYDIKPNHCGSEAGIKCAKEKTSITGGCSADEVVKILGKTIGTCNVNGFLELGLAITQFILGLVGSVALLAFIWGGFQMIMAGGDMKKIDSGKSSITAAVVGLVIVFTSYLLVQFVMKSLLGVQ